MTTITVSTVVAPSGWTLEGTTVRLTTATNSVIIGATAPLGSEKARITGGTAAIDFTSGTAFTVSPTGSTTPTLRVDTTLGRVGLGGITGSIEDVLHVVGNIRTSGASNATPGAWTPGSTHVFAGPAWRWRVPLVGAVTKAELTTVGLAVGGGSTGDVPSPSVPLHAFATNAAAGVQNIFRSRSGSHHPVPSMTKPG